MFEIRLEHEYDIPWLNADSRAFLERDYLQPGVTPEERIRAIAEAAEDILEIPGYADKFERYMHKGWISLSSPVWANFGIERGLPISCNGSYIDDSVASILGKTAEIGMMSKDGAGTSAYFGNIRPRGSAISGGGKTNGAVHFMELLETTTNVISQSSVRRGSCAVYLPVEHADVEEFLTLRSEGSTIQNLSLGVCITDAWMQAMIDGDQDKRALWAKIIQKRFETGYPYIFFTDTVNRGAPQVYKDKELTISHSNLCSEIALHDSAYESFVCDLSSLNVLHFDEWKDTDVVETLTYFLDAVLTEYIDKLSGNAFLEPAMRFAQNQRAIGIGILGWHSYLQSNMIAFESLKAKMLGIKITRFIQEHSRAASRELAEEYGEPPLLKGYGMRNVTTMAIAPTTSSSFILGQVSPSIEPHNSNYYVKDLAKGKFSFRNPHLKELLATKSKDTPEVWRDILLHGGSVQHLDFLDEHERDVFKTFGEISQLEIVIQASQRQKYIDQSQSLNLMIHPDTPLRDVNTLMTEAWRLGVKTLYYQRSTNPSQELGRNLLACSSCES